MRNETLRYGFCGATELAAQPAGHRVTEAACEQIQTSVIGYHPGVTDGYGFIVHRLLQLPADGGVTAFDCGVRRGRCVVAVETTGGDLASIPLTITGPLP